MEELVVGSLSATLWKLEGLGAGGVEAKGFTVE
jgi:hypothetical protein